MRMMIDRRAFVGGTLALGACASVPVASVPVPPPPLWGTLRPGPYGVGIAIESGRVQRWRWFPAVAGSGSATTVRDLGMLYSPSDPRAIYATGYDEPGDAAKFARLLDLAVASRRGASHARGRFPLVVLGQGFGFESPFHQLVLAEYLASWGYRVATAPLTGAGGGKPDVSPATLSAQIADLAFLAGGEPRGPGLALIGYDLGGMSVVALAGSGAVKPDLVVGIDTGLMSDKLTKDLVTSRADFAWSRLDMPYLHFTRSAAENAARNLPESFTIFERNNGAPRTLIRVPQMRHADFGTIGAIEGVHPGLFGTVSGQPALGYANTLFLIREALDHYLRGDRSAVWMPQVRPPITVQTWP